MKDSAVLARLGVTAGLATLLCIGCASQKDSHELNEGPTPVYDTAAGIMSMPRCKAVVIESGPCYVRLRSHKGKEFLIGSPGAEKEVQQFLEVLTPGERFSFPEVFQKFRSKGSKSVELKPTVLRSGAPRRLGGQNMKQDTGTGCPRPWQVSEQL